MKFSLIKNDKAYGVKVHDHHHEADAVLVNADFPYAVSNLIKNKKHLGKYTPKKIQKMKYSTSSFLLYLGLDKNTLAMSILFILLTVLKVIFTIFLKINCQTIQAFTFIRPHKSIQASHLAITKLSMCLFLFPLFMKLTMFGMIRSLKTTQQKILNLIAEDPKYHDIKDHIVVKHIMTPTDFENQFNLKFGATFGLRPTLFQSNYYRPHNTYKYVKKSLFCW